MLPGGRLLLIAVDKLNPSSHYESKSIPFNPDSV